MPLFITEIKKEKYFTSLARCPFMELFLIKALKTLKENFVSCGEKS